MHPNLKNYTMIKRILTICFVLFTLGRIQISAKADILCLRCEKIDPKPIHTDKGKAPMRMPEISMDGTTLLFQPYHSEYIINIVQNGEVVFTSVVPADAAQYELPDYISGECVIQFLTGNYCFWAEIEL